MKLCESSISSILRSHRSLTTTTLAALENSSRVVRAYLAYDGILRLMGLVGLITSCCKLLGARPNSLLGDNMGFLGSYMVSLVVILVSSVTIQVSSVVIWFLGVYMIFLVFK